MTGALCAAGRTAGVTAGRRCARSMRRLIIHQLLDEHHIKSTSRKDGRQAGEGTQDPQRMQQICETDRHDKRQMTKFRDGRVDPPSLLDVWALGIWALGVSINQPACTHNKRLGTCATRASNLTNIIKTWSNFLHSAAQDRRPIVVQIIQRHLCCERSTSGQRSMTRDRGMVLHR